MRWRNAAGHHRFAGQLSRMARAAALLLWMLLVPGVTGGRQAEPRILFIGNSLTYWNDLPAMVQSLAAAAKRRITCQQVAFPDVSLEDHWQRGDAVRAIRRGGWSHVVLQQGPRGEPLGNAILLWRCTHRMDCIHRGRAPTWPPRDRLANVGDHADRLARRRRPARHREATAGGGRGGGAPAGPERPCEVTGRGQDSLGSDGGR